MKKVATPIRRSAPVYVIGREGREEDEPTPTMIQTQKGIPPSAEAAVPWLSPGVEERGPDGESSRVEGDESSSEGESTIEGEATSREDGEGSSSAEGEGTPKDGVG